MLQGHIYLHLTSPLLSASSNVNSTLALERGADRNNIRSIGANLSTLERVLREQPLLSPILGIKVLHNH